MAQPKTVNLNLWQYQSVNANLSGLEAENSCNDPSEVGIREGVPERTHNKDQAEQKMQSSQIWRLGTGYQGHQVEADLGGIKKLDGQELMAITNDSY